MKTIKYVPEACKGEKPKLKGSVELALVKYTDKLKFLKNTGINLESDKPGESMGMSEKIEFGIKSIEFAKQYVLKVELEDLATKEKFESVEDLEYGELGGSVLQEISSFLINGSNLGK